MTIKMQFGVSTYSQIFDTACACNSGFTLFVIKTKQVGFPIEGDNSDLVDIELHEVRNAP
jgi:hypothetical protein